MSSSPPALIYAELLSNIRQVSVIAALSSPRTNDTKVAFSESRLAIELLHDGSTIRLALPAPISDACTIASSPLGSREMSWRFSLPPITTGRPLLDTVGTPSAPWSASTLSKVSEISCSRCANILIPAGSIGAWRDLPSENWAEMMDFWHCHKPDVHRSEEVGAASDQQLGVRGYGANNRFMARAGVGFVDLTYLLLSSADCHGFQVDGLPSQQSNGSRSSSQRLHCEQCHTVIGAVDQIADGLRIYKWALSVRTTGSSDEPASYPLSHFLTALLLSLISAQAVSKFIIHSTDSISISKGPPVLHVWVFAPYLTISLSSPGPTTPKPLRASKIFYRTISTAESTAIIENASMSVEEVRLPAPTVMELAETLHASTLKIPERIRKFKEWEVGFLERFGEEQDR